MKIKRKHLLYVLSNLLIITNLATLSISCSKNVVNNNIKDIDNFINNLKIKIKDDKKDQKANTLASTINTEEQVKQWFDGLPQSNNGVNVKFISSKPNKNNDSILEVIFTISKGSYSTNYTFIESGFKSEQKRITFKEFSEKNSFRITFQISDKYTNNEGEQTFHRNNGTAWSWYFKKNSDYLYDWYLMTNFHVVTNTVAYNKGFLKLNENNNNSLSLKDPNGLIDFYKNNITTNVDIDKSFFELLTYSDNEKYKSLIRINESEDRPTNNNFINKEVVKSINVITDFNNDSIDLFSKADQAKNVLYNLDMALVKISLDFSKHQNYLKNEYKRPDVVSKYLSDPNFYNRTKFNKSKWTSIGGHPRSQDKLVLANIGPNFYLDYKNLDIFDFVLPNLKAPYYYTSVPMSNFLLSAGASGSAAYQLVDQTLNDINENEEIPIGIFWGGQNVLSSNPNDFIPSIIPFITDESDPVTYNIFQNFKNTNFF